MVVSPHRNNPTTIGRRTAVSQLAVVPPGVSPIRRVLKETLGYMLDASALLTGDCSKTLTLARRADADHDRYARQLMVHLIAAEDVRGITLLNHLMHADEVEDGHCYTALPTTLRRVAGWLRRACTTLDVLLARKPKRTNAVQENLL